MPSCSRPSDEDFYGLPRPVFLYAGRVAAEKNIAAFLDLELPGSKVVVGDGPARADLEPRYPDVHWAGFKFGEELAQHYAGADVFVFPSRTDTFGVVMLEANAAGLPVAAYPSRRSAGRHPRGQERSSAGGSPRRLPGRAGAGPGGQPRSRPDHDLGPDARSSCATTSRCSDSTASKHEKTRIGGRAVHGIVPIASEFRWAQYRVGLPREWPPGGVRDSHQAGRRDARRWPRSTEQNERLTPPQGGEPERRRDERRTRR
jgi:hypothetical protein